jgi:2-polyprenyl-3-methyl-5-hydroxy-6-metoxy-1,4-benzoquinol methylase
MTCIVCGALLRNGLQPWHRVCGTCGYEAATLEPTINDTDVHARVNERDREMALQQLRRDNFGEIVVAIDARVRPGAARLLDVGCAHGWFLEQARARFDVLGIEPDLAIGAAAAARGLPVRAGYFPDALVDDERFDTIVFNDVLEHIPGIEAALDACRQRLEADGLLVVNLPSSSGVFYRLARLLARLGWNGPFARMWQKGLPSPHVHYFHKANLTQLVGRHGFELLHAFDLPSLHSTGLLQRLRFTGDTPRAILYSQYALLRCMIPMLRLMPSDIMVCIFRRR